MLVREQPLSFRAAMAVVLRNVQSFLPGEKIVTRCAGEERWRKLYVLYPLFESDAAHCAVVLVHHPGGAVTREEIGGWESALPLDYNSLDYLREVGSADVVAFDAVIDEGTLKELIRSAIRHRVSEAADNPGRVLSRDPTQMESPSGVVQPLLLTRRITGPLSRAPVPVEGGREHVLPVSDRSPPPDESKVWAVADADYAGLYGTVVARSEIVYYSGFKGMTKVKDVQDNDCLVFVCCIDIGAWPDFPAVLAKKYLPHASKNSLMDRVKAYGGLSVPAAVSGGVSLPVVSMDSLECRPGRVWVYADDYNDSRRAGMVAGPGTDIHVVDNIGLQKHADVGVVVIENIGEQDFAGYRARKVGVAPPVSNVALVNTRAGVVAQEDARTLWLDYDCQGDRYKDWKIVCNESSEQLEGESPVRARVPVCIGASMLIVSEAVRGCG